jgi:hypothetical protein
MTNEEEKAMRLNSWPPLMPAEIAMVQAVFRRHPENETATLDTVLESG